MNNAQWPHAALTDHTARKRFGQNFLRDRSVIEKILTSIDPQRLDAMVEIGPGQGALTLPLLSRLQRLQVIELDRDLVSLLHALPNQLPAANRGELRIENADALTINYRELASTLGGKLRVIGNLPYNISTPILFKLLEHVDAIADMHFMLQKEVVDRMACAPGSKVYGRLSVMLQAQCQVLYQFKVAPSSFTPVPKVDSAIVRLVPHADQPPPELLKALDEITRLSFSARRKTLSNGLQAVLSALEIAACGIDPKRRAETLSQAEFQALARALLSLR
jgi:16S rRNA (adenine1518-N6/adenine1519-N6)-dimethyltransferase